MNSTKQSILECLDNINDTAFVAEMDVLNMMAGYYAKSLLIMENYTGDDISCFQIYQEGDILDKATGKGKDEGFLKKTIAFIPRLIMAIIDAIRNGFKKKKLKKIEVKLENNQELSRREKELVEEVKKDKKKSPFYKAIVASGIAMSVSAAGMAVYSIMDYSEAVEFKDDVKFSISEKGTLKIIFPYYKIDQMKKFINEIDPKIKNAESLIGTDRFDIKSLNDIIKSFKGIVTNQSRIMEREFTIDEYNTFINDCKKTFEAFAGKLSSIKTLYEKIPDKDKQTRVPGEFVKELQALVKKTPGDIELITKLDEKIKKVYSIITDPNASSSQKRKVEKFKFEPVLQQNVFDIWKIDNSHLMTSIKLLNEIYNERNGRIDAETAKKIPKFRSALLEIERQFNIHVSWGVQDEVGGMTLTGDAKPGISDISISKTKGFDLGGATLKIVVDPGYVASAVSRSKTKPFGQVFCSIICHEIFHNIALLCNIYKSKLEAAFEKGFYEAAAAFETIKAFILQYISKCESNLAAAFGNKFKKNQAATEMAKKRLAYLFAKCDTEEKVKAYTKQIEMGTDEKLIENLSLDELMKEVDARESGKGTIEKTKMAVGFFTPIIRNCIAAIMLRYNFMLGGLTAITGLLFTIQRGLKLKMEGTNEEQMCDMCAAMYKVPVYLEDLKPLIKDGGKRKSESNSANRHDVHPSTYDRQTVSYEIARQMLDSGEKLEPEVREYLEFIIEKNQGVELTERKYTKKQIKKAAPEFNKNVKNAIHDFIQKHNIPVKEYAVFDELGAFYAL